MWFVDACLVGLKSCQNVKLTLVPRTQNPSYLQKWKSCDETCLGTGSRSLLLVRRRVICVLSIKK